MTWWNSLFIHYLPRWSPVCLLYLFFIAPSLKFLFCVPLFFRQELFLFLFFLFSSVDAGLITSPRAQHTTSHLFFMPLPKPTCRVLTAPLVFLQKSCDSDTREWRLGTKEGRNMDGWMIGCMDGWMQSECVTEAGWQLELVVSLQMHCSNEEMRLKPNIDLKKKKTNKKPPCHKTFPLFLCLPLMPHVQLYRHPRMNISTL